MTRFCGGGSIPLEAQRLGLEAHASDLNPVPVLITKALIELPPKFVGRPPVNPDARGGLVVERREGAEKRKSGRLGEVRAAGWKGAAGLAADIRYYGRWMRDEAERRIGLLYPKVHAYARRRHVSARHAGGNCGEEGRGTDRHRLAVGAHGRQSQPCGQRRACAAGAVVLAIHESGEESVGGTYSGPDHHDLSACGAVG